MVRYYNITIFSIIIYSITKFHILLSNIGDLFIDGVTFMPGSENHKKKWFFVSYFSRSSMALRSSFIDVFRKLKGTKTAWWSLYFVILQIFGVETFYWDFSGILRSKKLAEQLNNFFWAFSYFFFNFSIVHFSCLRPFASHLFFTKNFYLKIVI